ncbi:MAG: hypothetical protein AAFV07_13805 [Bacteroidota bacterium]
MARYFILVIATLAFLAPVSPAEASNRTDLFSEEAPLKVELVFNYKKFIRHKYKDEYMPAAIHIELEEGEVVSDTIRMKARGNFRRRFCTFPPIKLNFKKTDFTTPSLQSLETIKLVTNCKFQDVFQQYLYQEYLAYRLYNELTPESFRVRLVEITYTDSEGKKEPFTRIGFLIEDVDDVAKRNQAQKIKSERAVFSDIDPIVMNRVSLFEYMIGNSDWALGNMHNVKIVQSQDIANPRRILLPYDFDYCGMVNTHYALPHESLPIEKVTERIYLGPCVDPGTLDITFGQFIEKKERFMAIIQEFPLLDDRRKRLMTGYLEDFFEDMVKKGHTRRMLNVACNR